MNIPRKPIVITGARSFIAPHLLEALGPQAEGILVSRQATPGFDAGPGWHWTTLVPTQPGYTLINLMPLWALPDWLARAAPPGKIVTLASTSAFSLQGSASPRERETAAALRLAESDLEVYVRNHNTPLTLFRTTLLYDGQNDVSVAPLRRWLRQVPFAPLVHGGSGLRQPLHAEDVAAALVQAACLEVQGGYNLAGGETLSLRAMIERVAAVDHQRVCFLPLPAALPLFLLKLLPHNAGFGVLARMGHDQVYDDREARLAFNLAPRRFCP